jgi:hypothetical protein
MKRFLYSILTFLFFSAARAQFSPGNIVVVRVGDGSTALSGSAFPVSLLEYTSTGSLISTTNIPTADAGSNLGLTQSGSDFSEGMLSLSGDGRYLALCGYNASPGTATVASGNNLGVIARIDYNFNINSATSFIRTAGNAYVGNSFRSVVTDDGSAYWGSGTTGGATTTEGVRYISGGTSGAGTQISSTVTNTRNVRIFSDQLYVSTASGSSIRIGTVGSGLPTTAGQTITNLNGLPTSTHDPYEFVLLDADQNVTGPDLIYFCSFGSNAGLYKYSYDGTSWTARGSLAGNVVGLAARFNCSGNVDLFVTWATGVTVKPTVLYSFTDLAAFNADITSNGSALASVGTSIASAGSNYAFSGLAFTPTDGYIVTGSQSIAAGNYNVIKVKSGGTATLTGNIVVYSKIVVESGGTLDMGNYTISSPSGIGSSFEVLSGGALKIGSSLGVNYAPGLGNVQTCIRIYSQRATYEYTGTTPQATGDAFSTLTSSTGKLVINNTGGAGTSGVSLNQDVNILSSGELKMVSGNLTVGTHNLVIDGINQVGTPSLTDNHIVTNSTGSLTIRSVGAGPVDFPVGPSADSLNTVKISDGGSKNITIRVNKDIVPGIAFPSFGINRTWNIKASAVVSGVTMAFQYASNDANVNVPQPQAMEFLMYSGSVWNIMPGNSNLAPTGADPAWLVTTASTITINNSSTPYALGKNGTEILPLDFFITCKAQKVNNAALIGWNIADASAADHFEVQRSVNNAGFETIATVQPSMNQLDYHYTDAALANGTSLYRIKVVRRSGSTRYSNTVAVISNSKDVIINSIAPNPVNNKTMLSISSGAASTIDLVLVDINGRIIKQWRQFVQEGNSAIPLDLENIHAGVYFLTGFLTNSTTNSVRLVKQ